MSRRQRVTFRIGCWATLLTAAVHLLGSLTGGLQPATDAQAQMLAQARAVGLDLPGGQTRTLMDLFDGFGLFFSLALGLWGGLGLIVIKRGADDAALMYAVARAMAGAAAVTLVISLTYWFLIPSLFIALMTISFAVSAVRAP